jgi:hypothetical protein
MNRGVSSLGVCYTSSAIADAAAGVDGDVGIAGLW